MEGRQTWRYVDQQETPERSQTMLEAFSIGLDTVKFDFCFGLHNGEIKSPQS